MRDNQNSVLIFKAIADDLGAKDPYVSALAEKGYSVKTVPVLEFKFRNLEALKEKLNRPDQYSGLIFSNPRCVQAVYESIGTEEELPKEWKNLPVFAVGDTTANQARDLLNLNLDGTTSSNVGTLVSIILRS